MRPCGPAPQFGQALKRTMLWSVPVICHLGTEDRKAHKESASFALFASFVFNMVLFRVFRVFRGLLHLAKIPAENLT